VQLTASRTFEVRLDEAGKTNIVGNTYCQLALRRYTRHKHLSFPDAVEFGAHNMQAICFFKIT